MRTGWVCLIVLLLGGFVNAHAEESRPKVGLALSGGGARGFAHIGVLRVLEEMHVPIDYIAGTSIGALVGALYASGMSPDEIEKEVGVIDWNEALNDSTSYRQLSHRRKQDAARYPSTKEFGVKNKRITSSTGIRSGQRLNFVLASYLLPYLDESDFSKFPVPFVAVATDLETGDPVFLSHGDIAESVRASMSIPAVFTPVDIDGRLLVDGGSAMNLPVDVVRRMGADIVIAVDIAQPLYTRESLTSTLAIVDQLTTILTRSNMEPQLARADLIIAPDIEGVSLFAFDESAKIVPLGLNAAEAEREHLERYAIDPDTHARLIARHRVARERMVVIDEVRIVGNEFVDERFIADRFKASIGKPLDLETLERDIEWLYGSADFVGVRFALVRESDITALVITVREKPWGPDYLRAGLSLSGNAAQNVDVSLLFSYSKRWLNSRGAEWRTDLGLGRNPTIQTEIYQPRQFERPGFVRAGGGYTQQDIDIYEEDAIVAVYEVEQSYVYADLGLVASSLGEASLGVLYRWTDAAVTIGSPTLPRLTENEGALTAGLILDGRDNPFIPLSGADFRLKVIAPLEAFGASDDYAWVTLDLRGYRSRGKNTLFAGIRMADSIGGEPGTDLASLGGFLNHSGYAPGQLRGRASTLVQLGYYFESKAILPFLGKGAYFGGLVEAGDVGDDLGATLDDALVSVTGFIAVNTYFGPVSAGISKARDVDLQYYVTIGQSF